MKEEYTFNVQHSDLLIGMHGRGAPGRENSFAGLLYPILSVPAGISRGQPPPGDEIVIRGREPCGNALNTNAVPVGIHGTRRFATLTPQEYAGQAGFTTVVNLKVRRRNGGMAGFTFVHDSRIRRRLQDLSACAAPDNVWVQDDNVRVQDNNVRIALNPNAVPAGIHGTRRFSTLTPQEYAGQAGFTFVPDRKVRRRKEGSVGIMYMDDSCFRRRFEDLSAYAASRFIGTGSDNVWVHEKGPESIRYVHDSCFRRRSKDLSACAASDSVWV